MHTAKEQKLDGEKAWEQAYRNSSLNIIIFVGAALQLKMMNTLQRPLNIQLCRTCLFTGQPVQVAVSFMHVRPP